MTAPNKRAYGAAPSEFKGESEITKEGGKKTVNNFAYHISFETPASGLGSNENGTTHSGYTEAQYMSCAYLCSKTGVKLDRITTHKEVDIGQGKQDPRSFDRVKFEKLYNSFPLTKTIIFGINEE